MSTASTPRIHKVHGSGRWFPGSKTALRAEVKRHMAAADGKVPRGRLVAALAPHAGYLYSGKVAGYTFRAIQDMDATPDLVVVLGFSHRGAFDGVALLDADVIRTPLGDARMAVEATRRMAASGTRLTLDSTPHQGEHSAENEIPFLQVALPETPLVVGIIGDHNVGTLAQLHTALMELAADQYVLVVASTDLLHDPDYDRVTRTDRSTLALITRLDRKALAATWSYGHQVCCGIGPVLAAMQFAEAQGSKEGTLLHYRNSGDDYPDSRGDWVVGYGAVVFGSPCPE